MPKVRKETILLLLILLLAAVFRFWNLDSVPPGLYPDVAMNGNNALDAIKTGNFKLFYPENNGREGLFINLIAVSFAFFGASVWAMKVVAAILGLLTVWGLYLLAKELFRKEGPALFSAFFLATGFWAVNFSRIGFRAVMVPFCLVFAFYFLLRGLNKLALEKKLCPFCPLLAGLFFGLGFHTYISFRVVPLILLFVFVSFWLRSRKEGFQKMFFVYVLWFFVAVTIAALPIGLYFLQNPQDFIGRAAGVSVFGQANPIRALILSFVGHLAMFNFVGDFNWRHNPAGFPELLWPVGLLFLVGLFVSVKRLILSFREGLVSFFASGFLLALWSVMLLPGILTSEGVPHSLRTIGAIPGTFLLAGLGADILLRKIWPMVKKCRGLNPHFLSASLVILAVSFVLAEGNYYFVFWGQNPVVRDAFSSDLVAMGQYLNSLPENVHKYVVVNLDGVSVNGLPMPAQTPIFIERTQFGEPRAKYILPDQLTQIKSFGQTVVVMMKPDESLASQIKALYPQVNVVEEMKYQ